MLRFDSAASWYDRFRKEADQGSMTANAVTVHKDWTFGAPFTCTVVANDSSSVTIRPPDPACPEIFRLDPLVTESALSAQGTRNNRVLLFTTDADMAEFIKATQLRRYLKDHMDYLSRRSDSLGLTAAIECLRGNASKRDVQALLSAIEQMQDLSEQAGHPVRPQIDYTVCFLFTPDLSHVLLQTKDKTDFKGLFNGVGGKLESDESPMDCAAREIHEETGLDSVWNLHWLGTLELPDNCDNHNFNLNPYAPACRLYYYAGIFDPARLAPPAGAEKLSVRDVGFVISKTVDDRALAGNGDLQYFVQRGLSVLTDAMHRDADMRRRRDDYLKNLD